MMERVKLDKIVFLFIDLLENDEFPNLSHVSCKAEGCLLYQMYVVGCFDNGIYQDLENSFDEEF